MFNYSLELYWNYQVYNDGNKGSYKGEHNKFSKKMLLQLMTLLWSTRSQPFKVLLILLSRF